MWLFRFGCLSLYICDCIIEFIGDHTSLASQCGVVEVAQQVKDVWVLLTIMVSRRAQILLSNTYIVVTLSKTSKKS